MRVNLISIGKLSKKGFDVSFKNSKCQIRFNEELVDECNPWVENNNLYELKIKKKDKDIALTANKADEQWRLWHYRLGHLSVNNMKRIKAKDVEFSKVTNIQEFCESCALSKQTKLPHKTNELTNKKENHVTIHSDLMRPMRTKTLGSNCSYVVTYLCSKTQYSFVYLLKNKSDQEDKF